MPYDLSKYPMKPEVIAYLDRVAARYPDDSGALDVEENRRLYLAMCADFEAPVADDVATTNHQIPGRNGNIPIRIYENPQHHSPVTVIYYHGGGFVVGNLDSHHSICADIAHATGYRVVAADYRLAPEFVHPVPFEDALDVFLALDLGHTVVAGDSAGGTLAAAVCVAQHGSERQPVGQVLIYPWLGGEMFDLPSYDEKADAPGLSRQDIRDYQALRSAGAPETHDPTYFPLAHPDFSDLPACAAFAAEHDPIRDDAVEYVRRLDTAGVKATCTVERGLVHGYLRGRYMSADIGDSFRRTCDAIRELGAF
ncbi:MAG: alpha/beta hydrolase [Gammaproteobacteria bacterium]|nr:alpha/beta hydrolase [Gammaproteobacteria bacterium]